MNRSRLPAGAVLLALALVVPLVSAAPDPSFDPAGLLSTPWVGPGDTNGWHFRVPVTVEPRLNGTGEGLGAIDVGGLGLVSWPALVTLDLEDLLPRAGWLADPDTGNLASFELDQPSVRVVEVTGFARTDAAVERDATKSGMERYALPHLQFGGSLTSPDPVPFHPATEPVLSVIFLVDRPEERHFYHVYFDIVQNGRKSAPTLSDAERGSLDSIWYGRHANVFLTPSIAADRPHGKRCVIVTAQHDDTRVLATIGEKLVVPGTPPEEEAQLDAGQTTLLLLGDEEPTQGILKIMASKPVEAMVIVDNDNAVGSIDACQGGRLKPLGGVHTLPVGDARDQAFYVTTLSERLGVAHLAGERVTVRVNDVESGRELGSYTYDLARSRTQPGLVIPTPDHVVRVTVEGSDDARIALVSVGTGLVQGSTPTGRPADVVAVAPAGHNGQYWLSAPRLRSFVALEDGSSVLYQGNLSVPAGIDPVDGAPLRGFWSLIDGGKPIQTADGLAFARALLPSRPLSLYSSTNNVADTAQSLFTPIRGEGGTLFDAPVKGSSLVVVPQFPATRVDIQALTRSGISWTNRTVSPPGSVTLGADGGYVVHATKPVGAFLHRSSTSSFGGVLPGRPLFLEAAPSRVEWGGFLVGLATRETSVLVPPGQPATVPLDVHNFGRRTSGAFLPDKAEISARCVSPDCEWTIELSASTLGFPSPRDSPQRVTLTLTPPEDARPNDPAVTILVTARSLGNRAMVHELTLGAGVRIRYGVLATFDTATLFPDPRRSQVVDAGETARYDVAILNTGDVEDTFELRVLEVGGFAAHIVDGSGDDVTSVTLPSGEHAVLRLDVEAPPAGETAFLTSFATLAATSSGDSFQLSTVTAITSINPNVKVLLQADAARKLAIPGRDVTFNVTIVNLGDVSDVMRVAIEGSAPPGWEQARVLGLAIEDRVSVAPGRPVLVSVVTRPPAGAPPLSQYTLRLTVTPQSLSGGEGAGRLELTAVVDRHFDLEVEGTEVLVGEPLSEVPVPLVVRNVGNADETYRPVAGQLPPGWSLAAGPPIALAKGDEVRIEAALSFGGGPPPPGDYVVRLAFVPQSRPSASVAAPLVVSVFPFSGLALDLSRAPSEPLPAGRVHSLGVLVTNTGNLEALVDLSASAPDALRVEGLPVQLLFGPGETRRVAVTLQVRSQTPPGPLPFTFEAGSVGASASLEVPLVTEPLDLGIEGARLVSTDAGRVVQARVVNAGRATAYNATVTLEEAGLPLRNVTLSTLPPGTDSPVSLIVRPGADANVLALRLFGGEGAERDARDNLVTVERQEGRLLPEPLLGLVSALAAAAILVRRTRRPP